MSESESQEGYRISRTLEAVDREIRRQKRRHAEEEEIFPFEPGTDRIGRGAAGRPGNDGIAKASLYENAPISTHARLLLSDGISLPCPETLSNGEEIQAKLWEVIDALAARRTYIHHTNHLTNRELYSSLWTVQLNEVTRDLSECPGISCHIDLLDCGTSGEEESSRNDGVEAPRREFWRRDRFIENGLERRKPSYDRDRYLPRRGGW